MAVIRTQFGTRFGFCQHGAGQIILANGSTASPVVYTKGDALTCVDLALNQSLITEDEASDIRKDIEVAKMPHVHPLDLRAVHTAAGTAGMHFPEEQHISEVTDD